MRNKFLFALQRRLDYFELLAIAAILLGVAIIAGIVFTYDLSRQTVLDDARAQAQLYSKQLPDDLKHKRTRLAGITGAAILRFIRR